MLCASSSTTRRHRSCSSTDFSSPLRCSASTVPYVVSTCARSRELLEQKGDTDSDEATKRQRAL